MFVDGQGTQYKSEYLIVDTTAFIEHANLQDIGKNIITVQNVVDEITSKRQLRRLVVLPYELQIKDVFPENIKFVTEFSKKTGDYPSLSATDIAVMALVYQLEKQYVGIEHLNLAPKMSRSISSKPPSLPSEDVVGFFKGDSETSVDKTGPVETIVQEIHNNKEQSPSESDNFSDNNCQSIEQDTTDCLQKSLEEKFATLTCNLDSDLSTIGDVLVKLEDEDNYNETEESEDEGSEDGWITPSNIKLAKNKINEELVEDKIVTVACITTDFAMQNVLKQIGLNVVSLDGRVIKQIRTYILRCYACFKTTSIMTKIFCPNCGNKTLKKVSVSLDENGKQIIHINFSKPISTRGKRFSLPTPKGGKHANNPILIDKQPMPDQRPTRLAKTKNNPLDPDYIAGFSPFVMHDVNSKSAMLGIRGNNKEIKHWMRRNPNEVQKRRHKKKK
uniref:RNA-binding protein NOB1 n=2 Tax=Clastoptera arizonana TaxID=38151 RepID=A0A1B6DT19_9HEMI